MASLPEFIEAGMDFFTGKTVSASKLADLQKLHDAATARVTELEQANARQLEQLSVAATATTDLAAAKLTIDQHLATIKTLEAAKITAARQAQDQIAKVGAADPVSTGPSAAGIQAKVLTFPDRVAANVAKGMKKSAAVTAAIREFPEEHSTWLASGKTSSL